MTDEDSAQWRLLADASAAPGAGHARYAAAMHLYNRHLLGAEALEAFRVLAKRDCENPRIAFAAMGVPWPAEAISSEETLHALVHAIDAYLSLLRDPCIGVVREGIAHWCKGSVRKIGPASLSLASELKQALAAMDNIGLRSAIEAASPWLSWTTYDAYPLADIGEGFAKGHAFASLIGEGAPISADDFDLGLFLVAPRVFYRDHRHAAPELYAPLTGPHGWRFAPDAPLTWKEAHEPIWNEPWQPHAMLVGATPLLAIYCWTQNVNAPAEITRADDWHENEHK
jgi:Dimethlysulfonioproprionate lyase